MAKTNPEDRDPEAPISPGSNLKWKHLHLTHAAQVKGGSSKSITKKNAARIRAIREKGIRNRDIPWLYQRINDPKSNLINIMALLDKLVKESEHDPGYSFDMKKDIIKLHMAAHKLIYGDKMSIKADININVADEIADRIVGKIIDADFEEVKEDEES